MRVTPWRGKVCQQPRNVFCRVNALGHVATLYPDTIFFFFFHCSSLSSCYHSRYHSMGTISTAYARGKTATPSGGMQTTMPLLPLSLSPHTHHRHCLHSQARK